MPWIREHLGHILTIVLSGVLAGVIGFYSAIFVVKDDIQEIRDSISAVRISVTSDISTVNESLIELRTDMRHNASARYVDEIKNEVDIILVRMNEQIMPSLTEIEEQGDRIHQLEIRTIRVEERVIIIRAHPEQDDNNQIQSIR